MNSRQKAVVWVLASMILAVGIFSAGWGLAKRSEDPETVRISGFSEGSGAQVIAEALEDILTTSVDPPSERKLVRGAIKGMVKIVKKADPYALFYSPQSYLSFQELTSGQFSGIGVWLKDKKGVFEIVSVLPGTPAVDAGLERGDIIRTVDGADLADVPVDDAINRIKGPEGSVVSLGIERDGERLEVDIKRAAIELPNMRVSMLSDDAGYIRLFGFGRGAGDQLRDKIEMLVDRGARGVILDLRDNGGGLFTEGISVASAFVEDGDIVIYRQQGAEDVVYEAEGKAFEDIPLVVLVNEGTASASEIVAGALQDRQRALIVGTTTYGKGSVQEVVPLPDSSALKLTTAAYLTPNGNDINGDGIHPDVVAPGDPASQRKRALEILQGILISGSGAQG